MWKRLLAVTLLIIPTLARTASGQTLTVLASDTGLFSAVLRTALTEAGRGRLLVDPHPLRADDDLYVVARDALVPIPDSVLRKRAKLASSLGVRTVDAIEVAQNAACPGLFVVSSDSTGSKDPVHAGCPRESFYVIATGLPRLGTASLRSGEVYDRQNVRAANGYYAVRVLRTNLGPGGSSVYASDYVLRESGGTWTVVKVVGLMYFE